MRRAVTRNHLIAFNGTHVVSRVMS